jgi:hypothetical protein
MPTSGNHPQSKVHLEQVANLLPMMVKFHPRRHLGESMTHIGETDKLFDATLNRGEVNGTK